MIAAAGQHINIGTSFGSTHPNTPYLAQRPILSHGITGCVTSEKWVDLLQLQDRTNDLEVGYGHIQRSLL